MFKKRSILVLVLVLMMVLTFGCGGQDVEEPEEPNGGTEAPAEVVTLRLGHVVQEQAAIHQAALEMADYLKEQSGGTLLVEVYPASQLGGNRELVESIQSGTIDFAVPHVGILAGFTNNKTAIFEMPYIFKNDEAAEAICDGEIGQMLTDEAAEYGIKVMAYWTQGWRHITNAGKAVRTPEDMKGMKFRTMEVPLHMAHFNALGASAIPMAFSEVYTSLQQGVIDGQENPYVNIYLMGFYEVQPFLTETGHVYDPTPLLMSEITYDRLSAEHQQLIEEAAIIYRDRNRELSKENAEVYKSEILATGNNEIIELTEEERAKFREAAQVVYDNFEDQELLKRVEELQAGF